MMSVQSLRENKLRNENQEMFTLVREMLMQMTETSMKERAEFVERERKHEQISMLLGMAPALINSITGKEVFPQQSEDSALLDSFAKRLTPEMIQQLAQILPQDILAPMASRLKRALDEKTKHSQDGEKRLTNGVDTDRELS
jgi:hypothetical protein